MNTRLRKYRVTHIINIFAIWIKSEAITTDSINISGSNRNLYFSLLPFTLGYQTADNNTYFFCWIAWINRMRRFWNNFCTFCSVLFYFCFVFTSPIRFRFSPSSHLLLSPPTNFIHCEIYSLPFFCEHALATIIIRLYFCFLIFYAMVYLIEKTESFWAVICLNVCAPDYTTRYTEIHLVSASLHAHIMGFM